ncbi:MAG: hypothetical protein CM15mP8_4570 [Methanobacteriota archaeon]|nr:MAG: hypothetical protein CM15mP8_4570 [Euryarchaeota archaeon]
MAYLEQVVTDDDAQELDETITEENVSEHITDDDPDIDDR